MVALLPLAQARRRASVKLQALQYERFGRQHFSGASHVLFSTCSKKTLVCGNVFQSDFFRDILRKFRWE